MFHRLRFTTARPTSATRAAASQNARWLLSIVAVASLALLGACSGDDGTAGTSSSEDAGAGQADEQNDNGTDTDGEAADPATVADCLDEAGFQTMSSSDLLSEQQVEDQLTAFGQTESLSFDAETNAFAGGVSFYETPEQAAERAENLGDVAKAQSVVGNALINISAGTDFEDAVSAAETCLNG